MKILNKFKSILTAVMVLGLFFTMGTKSAYAADADIASGIYEVENEVYHESETGMAMSRSYLLPTMEVEVTKDGIVYTIGFSGSDYMENYRMLVNGEDTDIEIVDEVTEEGVVKLKVVVDKVDADMDALIYVAPMARDVEFKVIPKMETLTLIEAIEERNRRGYRRSSCRRFSRRSCYRSRCNIRSFRKDKTMAIAWWSSSCSL